MMHKEIIRDLYGTLGIARMCFLSEDAWESLNDLEVAINRFEQTLGEEYGYESA